MKVDLLVSNIGQLITCASSGGPKRGAAMSYIGLIENAAVAIKEGKFVGIGSSDVVGREFEADNEMDGAGRVVCPGFVDPHTHIVFAGNRLDEFERRIMGADYMEIL